MSVDGIHVVHILYAPYLASDFCGLTENGLVDCRAAQMVLPAPDGCFYLFPLASSDQTSLYATLPSPSTQAGSIRLSSLATTRYKAPLQSLQRVRNHQLVPIRHHPQRSPGDLRRSITGVVITSKALLPRIFQQKAKEPCRFHPHKLKLRCAAAIAGRVDFAAARTKTSREIIWLEEHWRRNHALHHLQQNSISLTARCPVIVHRHSVFLRADATVGFSSL